jgi:hypothetical protein
LLARTGALKTPAWGQEGYGDLLPAIHARMYNEPLTCCIYERTGFLPLRKAHQKLDAFETAVLTASLLLRGNFDYV